MQIAPKRKDETEAQYEDRLFRAYDSYKRWQKDAKKYDVISEAAGEEVANQKVYGIEPEPTEDVKKLMEELIKAQDKFEKKKSNG